VQLDNGDFSPLDATLTDKWDYHALIKGEKLPAKAE
jgi:hypothetical protein